MVGAEVSELDRGRDMEAMASTLDFNPSEMTSRWQASEQWGDVLLVDFHKFHCALGWGGLLSSGLRALLMYSLSQICTPWAPLDAGYLSSSEDLEPSPWQGRGLWECGLRKKEL